MSALENLIVEAPSLSPENLARFSRFITSHLGIKMSEAKAPMLQCRLMSRLRHLQLSSLDEYLEYLFNSENAEEEQIHFINAVTTNKTDFFREPQHFEFLVGTAAPNVLGSGRIPRLNVWCAGCSSGEEAYTLAMVLSELAKWQSSSDFVILATDISTKVLAHAKAGIYDEARIEPIPVPLRHSYLMRSKDRTRKLIRIVPELREKVAFHRLNFMDGNYRLRDQFDIIFFRNVMIYFDKPTQEAVIGKLCRNLSPGGYLFVGHSESLAGFDTPLEQVSSAVFRKPG